MHIAVILLRASPPQQAGGKGTPTSKQCCEVFLQSWVHWAGWPKNAMTDRGLNRRGRFARLSGARAICIRNIALESREQLGRTERHGDIWTGMLREQ
eukprot:2434662-Karenia_brevis.AAC.1